MTDIYEIANTVEVELKAITGKDIIQAEVYIEYRQESGLPAEVNLSKFENIKINNKEIKEWVEEKNKLIDEEIEDLIEEEEMKEEIIELIKEKIDYKTSNLHKMVEIGEIVI